MMPPYPWQQLPWDALARLTKQERLGHAIVLSGRPGIGTGELANRFAASRLCETAENTAAPCGSCRGCTLLAADSHPDFKRVAPADDGKSILIDQVRELTDYYALTSHYGRGKLTIIDPADAMNRAAANALLKILEEPPDGALLILVAHAFSGLPMTIRSRCVRVPCEQIDAGAARNWLESALPQADSAEIDHLLSETGGAPLTARMLADEEGNDIPARLVSAIAAIAAGRAHPLTAAKSFPGLSSERLIQLFASTASRLILAKFHCRSYYDRADGPPDPDLQGLTDHLNLKHLYAFLDLLFETRTLLVSHPGLRESDIVDSLWLGLAKMAGRGNVKED